MKYMIMLLVLTACGDNIEPVPDAPLAELPSCIALGCPDLTNSDRQCAVLNICECRGEPCNGILK